MNVDVEIYCKNIQNFFNNNPESKEELLSIVPGVTFESFMLKLTETSIDNFSNFGDPVLTRKQILGILKELYENYLKEHHKAVAKTAGLLDEENKIFQNIKGFMVGLN